MENNNSPFLVYCKNCGAPAGFDIVRQTYCCSSCGELTGIEQAKEQVLRWRELRKKNSSAVNEGQTAEEFTCPSCGARIVFAAGEASQTCDFCSSKLIRSELSSDGQEPDIIIPFFITQQEARERLLAWGRAHDKTPEGRAVISHIDELRGYYLPYRLVRGPVYGTVTRDSSRRRFEYAGYLEGTAVSASSQLDNQVLNEMEPFDWSQARPFSRGYLAGHSVKLSDVSDAEINDRTLSEVKEDFLPQIEKAMQTTGVGIRINSGELSSVSALLPVFFIKTGKLLAVMNGQTGRIAVSERRQKITFPWVIEPSVYTLLLTLLIGWWSGFILELMLMCGLVLGIIIFCVMSEGRTSLIRSITVRTKASRARRRGGALEVEEAENILKNPYDNTPVFYEKNESGRTVPVRIRFYTVGRWLFIIMNAFVTVFLPAIIAAVIRLALSGPAGFAEGFQPVYGAPWYVLAAFIVLLYLVKGVRRDVYDHPYIYEILPDGGERLIGKSRDRRVSVLSMFGDGETDEKGRRIGLIWLITHIGGMGYFLGISMLVLIIGSVAAILD